MIPVVPHIKENEFKDIYFNLRQKEGRIYSDEELALLPVVLSTHPHYAEWKLRTESAARLIDYFRKKRSVLKILEVGCGNGWLSHRLSAIPDSRITGLDINVAELRQAQRVFHSVPDLQFIYADIHTEQLKGIMFDCIVIAACIQYFPSITALIMDLFCLLKPGGELHILDSPFYKHNEVVAAKKRSEEYYREMGFPEMANHYFHHEKNELEGFDYTLLYRPSVFKSLFLSNKNPFPWFCIKKPDIL